MTDQFEFWIHGAAALIDWDAIGWGYDPPDQKKAKTLENPKNHFHVKRDARGCLLQLKKPPLDIYGNEVSNYNIWVPVFFAIPTATLIDDDETAYHTALLNCTTDQPTHLKIDFVQIFKGTKLIREFPEPITAIYPQPPKKSKKFVWDLTPHERCDAPLLIYANLHFYGMTWIWFEGAGARIETGFPGLLPEEKTS